MRALERILEIEEAFGEKIQGLVPLELDGESLRLILYLKDGTNLRVTEQWSEKTLKRYNYYWLTSANELKIGWDNAPIILVWLTSQIINTSEVEKIWNHRLKLPWKQ